MDLPLRSTISIRPIRPDDNMEELTALLHRAYADLGAMGLNYTAVDQSAEVTRLRIAEGRGFVAIDRAGRIVGTIAFYPPHRSDGSPWFERPDVAKFGQFAVDPPFQILEEGLDLGPPRRALFRGLPVQPPHHDVPDRVRHSLISSPAAFAL